MKRFMKVFASALVGVAAVFTMGSVKAAPAVSFSLGTVRSAVHQSVLIELENGNWRMYCAPKDGMYHRLDHVFVMLVGNTITDAVTLD